MTTQECWEVELERITSLTPDIENLKSATKAGIVTHRGWHESLVRYHFDSILDRAHGWCQYDTDQDAWYFGVWANTKLRMTLTFAEGDITIVRCHDLRSMQAEFKKMRKFYGPPPPSFRVLDAHGTMFHLYNKRPGE